VNIEEEILVGFLEKCIRLFVVNVAGSVRFRLNLLKEGLFIAENVMQKEEDFKFLNTFFLFLIFYLLIGKYFKKNFFTMHMFLAMKVGVKDVDVFLKSIDLLEKEGIKINGYELQIIKGDSIQEVVKAIEKIRENFNPNFQGLHPPFPAYADNTFSKWERLSSSMNMDYTVMHPSVKKNSITFLRESVFNCLNKARGRVFVENMVTRLNHFGANLIDAAFLSKNVLFDMHHAIFEYENSGRLRINPVEQLKLVFDSIVAVHCADSIKGEAAVPKNGGTKLFRELMKILFKKKNIFFIAEPKDGHLNQYIGHMETCRQIWKLWEEFKSKELN